MSTIRISVILAFLYLSVPMSAEPQQAVQAGQPLSSVVEYLQRDGSATNMDPRLPSLLGWPTKAEPYKSKLKVIEDGDGIHSGFLTTERGRVELILTLFIPKRRTAIFLTTPSGSMEGVIHGFQDQGRQDRPLAESREMFLKETHFWLRQAASATKK
jgi:hypothetical protein